MSRNFQQMVSLARRYCELIEAADAEDVFWLKEVAALFPKLHAAVDVCDYGAYDASVALTPDLDTRFELYSYLVEILSDRDPYWLEFDRADDSHGMTGSLADDLTDIYCELKHGLRMADEDPERSLNIWREGFTRHWGRHLIDAERHLAALAAQGRL